MALDPIRAVLFDMGGTLEELCYDETLRQEATRGLQALLAERNLDPGLDLPALQATLLSGIKTYQAWREPREVELPPENLWTEYIFPNHGLSRERLAAAADELASFYETRFYARSLRPEAPAVLEALHSRGLRLAIISNVLSRRTVPQMLTEYGIAHHFNPVLSSTVLGWRKPNPRIFLEAARLLGLPPSACAYVGDTVSRDVIGARRAGYGLTIQIKSFLTDKADCGAADVPPDAIIHDLHQVIDLVIRPTGRADGH